MSEQIVRIRSLGKLEGYVFLKNIWKKVATKANNNRRM